MRHWSAHCLEGALTAATILEQHGYPPLLLDLESQDKLDHVLFLLRHLFFPIDISLSACACLFPPITMLHDVIREYIAPWDKGNKNNNHQDGFDIFCRRAIDLVGGP